MKISPSYKVIKISQATPGDLLFIPQFDDPVLVVANPENEDSNLLLSLGENERLLEVTGDVVNNPCLKVCDEWRFRLEATISGEPVHNPISAQNGQIAINELGRFFISNLGGNVMPQKVVISLDEAPYLTNPLDASGEAFCFKWTLEIDLGGGTWERLTNPLTMATPAAS